MTLVAGVDSSTQSCKVVVRDAQTGELVRQGRARHPEGTEVHPHHWWDALQAAIADAGGLDDVEAISVGGQQHGMVVLDADGEVIREALLWNDTRSAQAAVDLIAELGDGDPAAGAQAWADAVGSVPVASLTITKLRWLRDNEPENAARVAAVALPHDWLTWKLAGGMAEVGFDGLVTDRSDASGTGYWSPITEDYRPDLLEMALGSVPRLPRVLAANEAGPVAPMFEKKPVLGPGAGDNAAAALALGLLPGDVAVSLGTSGVVSAISAAPIADGTGLVTGFADATGSYLPLAVTLNASRVLDAACRMLGVDHPGLSELALSAPAGADGLVHIPYLEGERTPNKPLSTGALHGMRLANTTPAHVARAAVEGMLCSLADGIDAMRAVGVPVERVFLIGGGAQSEAVRRIIPSIMGVDVQVPTPGEYVADGAARQAAWVLSGQDAPPAWSASSGAEVMTGEPTPVVREQYAAARDLTVDRPA
ncbi:xylulokinase [Cellulomonas sp. zg-ZUI222]|uniref:Xylulose kinase n=1 Tax=Cellulomonas wangleii TaxID=2816956 RepID=A0ABX8D690_9CELL|nr:MULTISPECIES: xylulokinase [Cellulomonas]MBO0901331.1 xylulokinase [Cellulomonas sp. zg-ZUI22]MBO0921777.1 xylulokinase [Cellulomonas wangleii]MBO0924801.1 xylulokinase [Cellulomonas wangleii]QVI62970.1 xylulokinase [Cellulomonas wangleii]